MWKSLKHPMLEGRAADMRLCFHFLGNLRTLWDAFGNLQNVCGYDQVIHEKSWHSQGKNLLPFSLTPKQVGRYKTSGTCTVYEQVVQIYEFIRGEKFNQDCLCEIDVFDSHIKHETHSSNQWCPQSFSFYQINWQDNIHHMSATPLSIEISCFCFQLFVKIRSSCLNQFIQTETSFIH